MDVAIDLSFAALQCNPIKHLQDLDLPLRESHPVERLIRLDADQRDRAQPFHDRLPVDALEGVPQREAKPGPLDVQARVNLACVLRHDLQVCPQGGAVALPSCQLVLGPAALR